MFVDIPFSTGKMKERKRGLEKSGQRRRMSWRYEKRVGGARGRDKNGSPSRERGKGKVGIKMPEKKKKGGTVRELDSTNLQCGECL